MCGSVLYFRLGNLQNGPKIVEIEIDQKLNSNHLKSTNTPTLKIEQLPEHPEALTDMKGLHVGLDPQLWAVAVVYECPDSLLTQLWKSLST